MIYKVQERSFKLDKPHFSVSKTGREVNPHARCKQKNFQKIKNQIWLKSQKSRLLFVIQKPPEEIWRKVYSTGCLALSVETYDCTQVAV